MEDYGSESPLTKLVPDLSGIHPDDAFSSIPYERGSALLYILEEILGGPGTTQRHSHSFMTLLRGRRADGLLRFLLAA